MKPLVLLGVLALALALALAGPAGAAGEAATTLEDVVSSRLDKPVILCGFYEEGGKILKITQSGDQVTAQIAQGETGCLTTGDTYFTGTLSGNRFSGKMQVCNPDICVEAGIGWPETRETKFRFTVFQDGNRLIGSWVHHRIQYSEQDGKVVSCEDIKEEAWADFGATKNSCWALQKSLAARKEALSHYETSVVTSTGAVRDETGRELASNFNQYQSWLAQELNKPGGGAGGGETEYWEFEDVMAGNNQGRDSACWCESRCDQAQTDCAKSYATDECLVHEAVHCANVVGFCEKYIQGKPYAQARRNWEDYKADTAAQMADEIMAYEASIAYLEGMLEEAGCH
jgi:hypothetical protein